MASPKMSKNIMVKYLLLCSDFVLEHILLRGRARCLVPCTEVRLRDGMKKQSLIPELDYGVLFTMEHPEPSKCPHGPLAGSQPSSSAVVRSSPLLQRWYGPDHTLINTKPIKLLASPPSYPPPPTCSVPIPPHVL